VLYSVGSGGDLYKRRKSVLTSPSPQYQSMSGSASSTTSGPRSNLYASTLSLNGRSITSAGSYDCQSPADVLPLNPSSQGSLSRTNHERALSVSKPLMATRKLSNTVIYSNQSTGPKIQGALMCECCPKKTKKFDSKNELK
jgi:hypothetical protein